LEKYIIIKNYPFLFAVRSKGFSFEFERLSNGETFIISIVIITMFGKNLLGFCHFFTFHFLFFVNFFVKWQFQHGGSKFYQFFCFCCFFVKIMTIILS
jgi:hypothetical protein